MGSYSLTYFYHIENEDWMFIVFWLKDKKVKVERCWSSERRIKSYLKLEIKRDQTNVDRESIEKLFNSEVIE